MPGGYLNIISTGNNNIILTGNPTKTFFKAVYSKYTNFGMQKFRLDYDGQRVLRLTEPSTFVFKVKRYAELLMDTYLVVNLPDIWSPIFNPCENTNNFWSPYCFKWIKNIGTAMIKEITITCGSLTIQKYTGDYLLSLVERDFTTEKKNLYDRMTGNIPELNNPANIYGRTNVYPSAYYSNFTNGAEPSIRGKTLYIPINTWFTLDAKCAFPLISLQYNELIITVTLRPIQELFQVKDVFNMAYNNPYIQPDFNKSQFQMYRFLQSPPSIQSDNSFYENQNTNWNADIHLLSTYCFLSKDEARVFAEEDQAYLIKDVFRYEFQKVTGTSRVGLTSNGMISNWMWYLQRDDVNMRNEWTNYTNWPYEGIPSNVINPPYTNDNPTLFNGLGPYVNPSTGFNSGIYITGNYASYNRKEILETMGILLDGEYRENTLTRGIYDFIEKYTRTSGNASEGLYCYNFCLNSSSLEYQPSGAMNLSRFKNIDLEVSTFIPQINLTDSAYGVICDGSGNIIGINKQNWQMFQYNYNMVLFEERYNILSFMSGNCGMLYAR